MRYVDFFIPGKPVAKQRARTVTRGKGGNVLPFARTYTPKETVSYENLVRSIAFEAMGGRELFAGPISIRATFYMAMPASWSVKRQQLGVTSEIRATKKPDLDNLLKSVKDACNQVVWKDDSQIVELVAVKEYSTRPGVDVYVQEAHGRPAP